MSKREHANYGMACFPDPNPPDHFEEVEKYGLRKLLAAYVADKSDVYIFDPDHAMLAYPVRVIKNMGAVVSGAAQSSSESEIVYLRAVSKDPSGPLNQLLSLMIP
jgi:hypothetical protein